MFNRREIVLGAGAAAVLGASVGRSSAAPMLRFGHALPPSHPFSAGVEAAAKEAKENTEGRVNIRVFPGSTLGGDADMLSQLRSGAIDMYALSPLVLATLIPVASISGMPFAFKDYSTVWQALDGDLGQLVRDQAETVGLHVVGGLFDTGFRQFITNGKPINAPEDLAGFKIRVPPSPLWISTMQALGAAPAGISYAEVYSALQTGIVDGFENNLVGVEASKFYEVTKYLSMVNYMWDGMIVLINKRSLERLDEADRKTLSVAYDFAAKHQRAEVEKLNVELIEALKGKGMEFTQPDASLFKVALQKADFYNSWKTKYGEQAWATLEKYTGKLA